MSEAEVAQRLIENLTTNIGTINAIMIAINVLIFFVVTTAASRSFETLSEVRAIEARLQNQVRATGNSLAGGRYQPDPDVIRAQTNRPRKEKKQKPKR